MYIISTTCILVNALLEQIMTASHGDHIETFLFPNMFDDVSSRDWGLVSSILSKLVITMCPAGESHNTNPKITATHMLLYFRLLFVCIISYMLLYFAFLV